MNSARFAAVILALVVAGTALAAGEPGKSTQQGQTGAEDFDLQAVVPGEGPAPEQERTLHFFEDSTFFGQARSFYLYRDKYDDSLSEAWAMGGSVGWLSGYAGGHFRIGAVAYASFPVHAPDDRDGTLLLKPDQEGYAVLGQIYGEVKIVDDVVFNFGRKEYNTPYLNKNDVRMTPNTFQAANFFGKHGGKDGHPEWKWGVGFASDIKERNSDKFVPMSEDAGAPDNVERGVWVAGVNFKDAGWNAGLFEYYSEDIINILYGELSHEWKWGEKDRRKLKLSGQYSDQQSVDEDLLTGSEFETNQWGAKVDLTIGGSMFTAAYTQTDDESTMRNPWSGHPGYTSVQLQDFYRADESAFMLRYSYDFTNVGAKGFSVYALWVHGSGVDAPLFNEDEYDINLQWAPDKFHVLRGLSMRLRYAHVDQDGGGDPDIDDLRFIVNYDLPRAKSQ